MWKNSDKDNNIKEIEMEPNNGFMQSVTRIPRNTNEANFPIIALGASREEAYQTPRLANKNFSFKGALRLLENTSPTHQTPYATNLENNLFFKAEKSVSCTDTNDSGAVFLKKAKKSNEEIKEVLEESGTYQIYSGSKNSKNTKGKGDMEKNISTY